MIHAYRSPEELAAELEAAEREHAAWPRSTVLIARLPLPPSANHLTINVGNHHGRVKTSSAIRFAGEVRGIINDAMLAWGFSHLRRPTVAEGTRYALTLYTYFENDQSLNASDADNRLKATQDGVTKAAGFDDNRIFDVRSIKAGVGVIEGYCLLKLERYE